MTLLIQLSDLHIKAGRRLAYGRVDTAAMLEACVAQVVARHSEADAVVITGDLVDHGRPDDYALLRGLLAPLLRDVARRPVFLLPGNHDERGALRAAFPEFEYLQSGEPFVQYEATVGPLRLLALDTLVPGEGGGELCAQRLDWLSQRLSESDRPTLLLMHHPPFETGIDHMDRLGLRGADAFEAIVSRHPRVQAILCGHLHRTIHARVGGAPASTCPSPAHQIALDFDAAARGRYVMEPAGYQLHRWDGRRLVTHTACVGAFDGPHSFRDAAAPG